MSFNVNNQGVIMQVGFSPNINFQNRSGRSQSGESYKHHPARETVGDISKFAVKTGEMTKASFKAVMYGLTAEVAMLTANWLFKSLPRAAKGKTEMSFWQTIKHPIKSISKAGKWASAGVALCVAGYHIARGVLKSNQRTANVDHQLKIGHRDK